MAERVAHLRSGATNVPRKLHFLVTDRGDPGERAVEIALERVANGEQLDADWAETALLEWQPRQRERGEAHCRLEERPALHRLCRSVRSTAYAHTRAVSAMWVRRGAVRLATRIQTRWRGSHFVALARLPAYIINYY